MASGDSLLFYEPSPIITPNWLWVAFTSGSTEPTPGDVIHGDTSNATATLEYISLESGTWGGGTAAGWMFLSEWDATAWTSGENFTANSGTPGNHGTLTSTPASCYATLDTLGDATVYDFDDTTNECLIFSGTIPSHYTGGGITVKCQIATAAATGDVSFGGMFRSFTDDTDNLVAGTAFNTWGTRDNNQAIDAPSAIGEITYDTIAFASGAELDNAAAGEKFHFLLFRDAQDSTNDDHTGDAMLVAFTMEET